MISIIMAVVVTVLIVIITKGSSLNTNKASYLLMFLMALITVIIYFILRNTSYFTNIFNESIFISYEIMGLIIFSMSISLIINTFLANIIQKIYELLIIKKCEENEYEKNINYYRDILKRESTAILSYCYNRNSKIDDDIVSTILNLKLHNEIKITEDYKIKLMNKANLKPHEKFIINSINNGFINNNDFELKYRKLLISDLIKNNYITTTEKGKFDITELIQLCIVWMIIYMIITLPIFFYVLHSPLFLVLSYVICFVVIPIIQKIAEKINPIIRKEKALELQGKLKGLKKYILNYSDIKNNGIDNINLFDEYVIYAIIFDIKGMLNKECKELYKNLLTHN